jgi:hypothetical protein
MKSRRSGRGVNMRELNKFELKVLKRDAAGKALALMESDLKLRDLLDNTEDTEVYCKPMTICECYDYYVIYFIDKIKAMEVLNK